MVVCHIPDEVSPTHPLPWLSYFAAIGRQNQNPLHSLFILSNHEDFISFAHGVPAPALPLPPNNAPVCSVCGLR